jgi:hypothetical protein
MSKNNGIVLVEVGVQWTPDAGGEERDLSVAYYAPPGRHSDLARVLVGPTIATHQERDGGHPVLTPEQARRVGWALLEAADMAEAEAKK